MRKKKVKNPPEILIKDLPPVRQVTENLSLDLWRLFLKSPFTSLYFSDSYIKRLRLIQNFLLERIDLLSDELSDLENKQFKYSRRYADSVSDEERKDCIIEFSQELGSRGRALSQDKSAFSRWFGMDSMMERWRKKHSNIEYQIWFLIDRLRVILVELIHVEESVSWQKTIPQDLFLQFLIYQGDSRINECTVKAVLDICEALKKKKSEDIIGRRIEALLIRLAQEGSQDIWIRAKALRIISLFSLESFFKILRQVIKKKTAKNGIFFRYEALDILFDQDFQDPEVLELIDLFIEDTSPYVRQKLIELLLQNDRYFQAQLERMIAREISPEVLAKAAVSVQRESSFWIIELILKQSQNESVLRSALYAFYVVVDRLVCEEKFDLAKDIYRRVIDDLNALRMSADSIAVRRWIAQYLRRLDVLLNPNLKRLMDVILSITSNQKEGTRRRIKPVVFDAYSEDEIGMVLSACSQDSFSLSIGKTVWGTWLYKGDVFNFRLWRFLYELFHSSVDKRQAWDHTTGREFTGQIHAPSEVLAELSPTKVPGEPVYMESDIGWRPWVPLVDEFISLNHVLFHKKVRRYTSQGVTEIASPKRFWKRLYAAYRLNVHFSEYASMRNWISSHGGNPNTYIQSLRALGFTVAFERNQAVSPLRELEPESLTFFSNPPFLISLGLVYWWNDLKSYFYSVYGNTLYDLMLFLAALSAGFIARIVWLSYLVNRARKKIGIVIGGWGTRGKSGTERLKAALFEALGHGVISKSTGCEAMFMYSYPFGRNKEMFLFRPFDKATIWEHHRLIQFAARMKAKVFLWECMGLTHSYVKILQRMWSRDDISTITNTYPDHEDLQGPAGINIPYVMRNFIPQKAVCITTEEIMTPILRQGAKELETRLVETGWLQAGLLPQDILQKFPYEEHPYNIALVLTLAEEMGVDSNFALKEICDRVIADIGVLKAFPVAHLNHRKLEFINGMSANERFGCLGNWKRMGFYKHDYINEPDLIVSALVNNRADRVPRSRVFAKILVEDIQTDYIFIVGTNLAGFQGYIGDALNEYLNQQSLFPDDSLNKELACDVLLKTWKHFRLPWEIEYVSRKLTLCLTGLSEIDLLSKVDDFVSNPGLLKDELSSRYDDEVISSLIRLLEKLIFHVELYENFIFRINNSKKDRVLSLEHDFREAIRSAFLDKLVVFENYHSTGDQIISRISKTIPPGLSTRIMGMQNIKGPGLDFIYRWQAWELIYISCLKILISDEKIFSDGLESLLNVRDFGPLSESFVSNTIDDVIKKPYSQSAKHQTELRIIKNNLEECLKERQETEKGARSSHFAKFVLDLIEPILDAGDSIKRRKIANKIYKDLADERISHERAALELQKLTLKQKGGWLSKKYLS